MKTAVLVDTSLSHANLIKKKLDYSALGMSLIVEYSDINWLEKVKHVRPDLLMVGMLTFSSVSELVTETLKYMPSIPVVVIEQSASTAIEFSAMRNVLFCSMKELTTEYLLRLQIRQEEGMAPGNKQVDEIAIAEMEDDQRLLRVPVGTETFYLLRIVPLNQLSRTNCLSIKRCITETLEDLLVDCFVENHGGVCIVMRETLEKSLLYSIKIAGEMIRLLHQAITEKGIRIAPILISEKITKKSVLNAYHELVEAEDLLFFCPERIVLTMSQLNSLRQPPDYGFLDSQIETLQYHLLEGNAADSMSCIDALYQQGIKPTKSLNVLQYCRKRLEAAFAIYTMLQKRIVTEIGNLPHAFSIEDEKKKMQEYVAEVLSGSEVKGALHTKTIAALQYMLQHYTEDLSLEAVADYLALSAPYFSKLFKKDIGKGFVEFLMELRIEKAKSLMNAGMSNVQAIASQSGFNDSKYFSRVFRKKCGISPVQFIDQLRKKLREDV